VASNPGELSAIKGNGRDKSRPYKNERDLIVGTQYIASTGEEYDRENGRTAVRPYTGTPLSRIENGRINPRPYAIIPFLLTALAVRLHQITELALYADERLHIRRAAEVYTFREHPAVESNGKFLFYFLPGIFELGGPDTIFVSRAIVALVALVTCALVWRVGYELGGKPAAFVGLAFYTVVPFAVFFERMALADPLAGLLGTCLAWSAIRFARKPNRKRALWAGLFIALTPAAKASTGLLGILPALAYVLVWGVRDFKPAFRYGLQAALLAAGLWALVLVPAFVENVTTGKKYTLYPYGLTDPTTEALTLFDKVDAFGDKMARLVSVPMSLAACGLALLALRRWPRRTTLVLAWLVLVWFPAFFIVGARSFQSRYLMSGLPALAVLIGLGGAALSRYRWGNLTMTGGLAVWTILFALPFALRPLDDLSLPGLDEKDYFSGYYNAYGVQDALLSLDGEPETSEILLGTLWCPPEYLAPGVVYTCDKNFRPETLSADFLLTDRTETPPPGYEFLRRFPKPRGIIAIMVWRRVIP
jgi:hypothetical protein